MKTLAFLLITILGLYACADKEKDNQLKDLRILSAAEQEGKNIRITSSIPSYTESGEKISKKEWGIFMDMNHYERIIYTDSSNEIKAIVFKKRKGIDPNKQPIKMIDKTAGLIGKPASNFILKDLKGNNVELKGLKGKVVVVNFWFTECKPCILEMEDLSALKDQYNSSVVFLGITFDEPEKIVTFLKTTPFNYTILPEAKAVCNDWGINGYPTNMVIDKNGIIQHVKVGLDRTIKDQLDSTIQRLL